MRIIGKWTGELPGLFCYEKAATCSKSCSRPAFTSTTLRVPKVLLLLAGVLLMAGALWGAPPHKMALDLDGENDGIEISDSERGYQHLLEGEGVIEFWCSPRVITTGGSHSRRQFAVSFAGSVEERHRDINIGIHNMGHWWIIMSDSNGYVAQAACSMEPIQEGEWYHIAVIMGGDDRGFYLNGEKAGSWDEFSASTGSWENNLHFGYTPWENRHWNGMLSEIRIWDENLTAEDINARMNQKLDGNEEGLVGYWPMSGEDNDEDAVADLAGDKGGRYVGDPGWRLAQPFSVDISTVMVEEEERDAVTLGPVELQDPEGDVSYQWYHEDSPIEGETGPSLTIRDITYFDTGRYYVVADDDRDVTPVESRRARVMRKHEIKSEVEPVDWSEISPEMVDEKDLHGRIAYYLAHVHTLANSIIEEGEDRGFIDWGGYRTPHATYNHRVMENITSLTWFYTKDAPWNPYYGDEALRSRIEAAMIFWVTEQSEDGQFSEYGAGDWHLAGTAFATKFMGETLIMLEDGPPIDPMIHEAVLEAQRSAIMVLLDGWRWGTGTRYSNQYTNVFAGAMAYLHLYEDEEMEEKLEYRMKRSLDEFKSTAGYMYENIGPDWGYYLGTHHSNVNMMWYYGRERRLPEGNEFETFGDIVREEYEHTTDWLSYNAVLQPGENVFFLNRALESRTSRPAFEPRSNMHLSEVVPLARAFSITDVEWDEKLEEERRELNETWGDPPSLDSFSAYAYLHHEHLRWYPSEEQRREAREELPYIAEDRFVHQRKDDRLGQVFTYIRRPSYYTAFNETASISRLAASYYKNRQGCGLGMFWHPQHGILLQSNPESREHSWGTRRSGENYPREGGGVSPSYKDVEPQAGARDIPNGDFEITYSVGYGERRVVFEEEGISITSGLNEDEEAGGFVEQIPLLLAEDDELEVEEAENRLRVLRDGEAVLTIEFEIVQDINVHEGDTIHGLRRSAVHAEAEEPLNYRISF